MEEQKKEDRKEGLCGISVASECSGQFHFPEPPIIYTWEGFELFFWMNNFTMVIHASLVSGQEYLKKRKKKVLFRELNLARNMN